MPQPLHVAFQGEIGAYSEEAALALFPNAQLVPCPSFRAVFDAVTNGTADRAAVPIENSLFGSVHINYDLLREFNLVITGELNLRIRHHLMVLPGVQPADVRRVISHPQALGQCDEYVRSHFPKAAIEPVYDTAGAAKMVAHEGWRDTAAIASVRAAAEYQLDVLAASIETNQQNYTRFLSLVRRAEAEAIQPTAETPQKTSIVYAMRANVPGALFKSLAVFALRDLDLFKIESRPRIGSPGSYLFYLDLAGSTADEPVQRALDHLGEITASLKVLGSYEHGQTVG